MNAFKTYDIRGIYPSEINENLFYKIGLSIKKLKIKEIVVGRDARLSSDSLFNSYTKGLIEAGVKVIDLGVITSPMLSYYCVFNKKIGSMITASHNSKEYNGIKFVDEKGIQLGYEIFLKKIKKAINEKKPIKITKKGKMEYTDMLQIYRKNIHDKLTHHFIRELKVVFDCSNGVGGIPLIQILPYLNVKPIIINEKPDGSFPAHDPDQTKSENLEQLRKEVIRSKADLGIMYDGDADRCGFVDEKGNVVPIDLAFLLLALREVRKSRVQYPLVTYDLRFSKSVGEFLYENFATGVIMRVGNPFHKIYLHKNKKCVMSGEYSGHIMYKSNYGIDDALFASLKMIEILSKTSEKFSSMISSHKRYASSGEISLNVKNPKKIIKYIESKYKKYQRKHIDGLSVIKEEVWFNIRSSNTEDLIRLLIEGINSKSVEKEKKILIDLIKKANKK